MDYPVTLTLRSLPTLSGLDLAELLTQTLICCLSRQFRHQASFGVCAGTAALPHALPRVLVARSGGAEEGESCAQRFIAGGSIHGRHCTGCSRSRLPADSRYKSLYYRPSCQTTDELGFLHCHCTYKIVVLFLLSHVGSRPFR